MTYKCPFLAATCINVSSLEVSYYEIILKYSSSVNPSSYITGLDLVFYMLSIFNKASSNVFKTRFDSLIKVVVSMFNYLSV